MNGLTDSDRLALAARQFVGSPFRLYGRDARRGFDCIGLVHASLVAIGRDPRAPEGYELKNADPQHWFGFAHRSGLVDAEGEIAPGDVLLLQPAPAQYHLAIAANATSGIHAHAGLRRVVWQKMDFTMSQVRHWRLSDKSGD